MSVPTLTHTARSAQLVGAAIDVVDDVGVAGSSLVRIARQARVSRGVINYHFTDRATLFDAVVDHVYALGRSEVGTQVEAAASATDALAAMIRGSITFYAHVPREMRVLVALYSADDPDTPSRATRPEHVDEMRRLRDILRRGQEANEFRPFDVDVVADAIRAILDAMLFRVIAGDDPAHLTTEVEAFCAAAIAPR